jgi:alpha-ketoglutarate-dependent taurine dioxygenase
MKTSKIPGLGSYGLYIDDVDFDHITDEEWLEVGKLALKNLVVILRNTNLKKDDMIDRIKAFGPPRDQFRYRMCEKYNLTWRELLARANQKDEFFEREDQMFLDMVYYMQEETESGKMLTRVSGKKDEKGNPLGLFAEGELLWHSNEAGQYNFTPGVALLGYQNVIGSCTGFMTTPDYYESVTESFRSELDEMIMIHNWTSGKINPGLREAQDYIVHANMCPEENSELPLVMKSPGGITGLHYSVNTITGIKGMSDAEAQKVFDELNKNLFTEKYMYDHWYKTNGDLLLFDNSICLHRRLGDIKDRLCYRIQHDYVNLYKGLYNPYDKEPFKSAYINRMKDACEYLNLNYSFDNYEFK